MEIKDFIKKLLKESLLKESYNESFDDFLSNKPYELLSDIKNKKPIKFNLIPKNIYHKALQEYVKYGEFNRFPVKYIYNWKNILLKNIAQLYVLTEIHGHGSSFPYDEFYDVFDNSEEQESNQYDLFTGKPTTVNNNGEFTTWCKTKYKETNDSDYLKENNWNIIYNFLDQVYNIDDVTPQFSNGHHVLSDYATEPLMGLGYELDEVESPEEIIIIINKILDVAHQRSDIAEIFIEGGTKSLEYISN